MSNLVPGQQTIPELELELGYSAARLRPAHETFCFEYVLSGASAKLAYLRAYPGSSEASALANSCRLLKTTKIQDRISEVRQELQRRFGVGASDVIRLLAMSMQVDRRQFVDKEGRPLDLYQLPAEAAAIVDIEVVIDRHGVKHALPVIPKRLAAADSLAKVMGISKDKLEVSGAIGHAAVNIYIPDNGRDQMPDIDRTRLQTLREKMQALKDAGVIA